MQNSNNNQPIPTDSSRENEEGSSAGWSIPKPATIPSPTYWPFFLALGATLMGLGIPTSYVISATGTVLFILAIIKWVGEISSEDR